ncbi:MAG: APC family permease [Nitrospirae bacterium]|nr:APC family permease [Nitrospirota bacterium]MCL5238600.1 APC family permease [Nitrospirota bacterium]
MSLKRILIGSPIETVKEKHERLTKTMGLAVFSSDALSSVAYGPEEILLALAAGGTAFMHYSVPIAISIVILIAIVATSYFQTIHAYPSGGGAYIVAKENLGTYPGLVAGAALLIDYVLTVTVSISAGIAAITSAFPGLVSHTVTMCLLAIILVMVINLRGVRESGRVFSIPVYLFVGGLLLLIAVGFTKSFSPSHPVFFEYKTSTTNMLSLFIILKAFASGCATLTGIEAVSNGVRAFKAPEAKNAGITLVWMAVILGVLTIGIAVFADHFGILPKENETVLSQLARIIFSKGPIYYTIQFSTSLILILAANTSFADFPRLSSIMAADRYLPRQLSNRGDKLVFSNGILILGFLSALLIVMFSGDTHALIPLYAVGVFTAFTLSQAGMVRHWLTYKGKGWLKGMMINGIGTITTAIVLVVIATEKFSHGAWMVLIAIPVLVWLTRKVHQHYIAIAEQLSVTACEPAAKEYMHHSVVIPVSGIQQAVINAIKYAKALSNDVVAVYVCLDPVETEKIKTKWDRLCMGVPLIILDSPYRSVIEPLIDYIDEVRNKYPEGVITVILPEFVPSRWWHHLLHNQTALFIKGILLFKRGVVSTSVPFHLRR